MIQVAKHLWEKVMRVLIWNSAAGPRQKRLSWHANLKALVDAANAQRQSSSKLQPQQSDAWDSIILTDTETHKTRGFLLHHRYLSTWIHSWPLVLHTTTKKPDSRSSRNLLCATATHCKWWRGEEKKYKSRCFFFNKKWNRYSNNLCCYWCLYVDPLGRLRERR